MITMDRVLARQARAVFRKLFGRQGHSLGVPLKITTGSEGLVLEAVSHQGAARYQQSGRFEANETFLVPLSFLDDCQANRPSQVTIEQARRVVTAQWTDGRVPQLVQYSGSEFSKAEPFPQLPETWNTNEAQLLSALSAAMETCDPYSTRMTLGCVLLSGKRGRIAATDGRQVYLHEGFSFGWDDDVLLPANPVLSCRELFADKPVEVGVTAHFVSLDTGGWTIALPRQLEGKFPDIDSVIPLPDQITATAMLVREDIDFLKQSLAKLRCDEGLDLPITIDLNGRVVIRCQPTGQPKPLELVLSNSQCDGAQVSFGATRTRLLRALELGLDQIQFADEQQPVLCQSGNCRYAWAPFDKDSVIAANKNAICLASPLLETTPETLPAVGRRRRPANASNGDHVTAPIEPSVEAPTVHDPAPAVCPSASTLPDLIQQAETLHDGLRQMQKQNRELIKTLKLHRRQTKLRRKWSSPAGDLQAT